MALVDIDGYQGVVTQTEETLERVTSNRPSSADLVITEVELNAIVEYEKLEKETSDNLERAKQQLQVAKDKFLALLPQSVQQDMRKQGKAVYASWVEQDANQRQYGPYAAYFVDDELQIERFTDFRQFVARFEAMREKEEGESLFGEYYE